MIKLHSIIYKLAIGFLIMGILFVFLQCKIEDSDMPVEEGSITTQFNEISVELSRVQISEVPEKIWTMGEVDGIYSVIQYPPVPGIAVNLRIQVGSLVSQNDWIVEIDRNRSGLDFRYSPVYATAKGVVTEIYIQDGDTLTLETPICKIVEIEYVKVNASIMDEELNRVNEYMPALIKVPAYNQVFNGYVHKIHPSVNPQTRTVTVEIYRDNSDGKLRPGMYAEVEIIQDNTRRMILIPLKAIVFNRSVKYVFLYDPSSQTVKKREIFTGELYGDSYEVTYGLSGGELFVIEGQQYCYDGEKVDAVNLMEVLSPQDIENLEHNLEQENSDISTQNNIPSLNNEN